MNRRIRLALAAAAPAFFAACTFGPFSMLPDLPPISELQAVVKSFVLRDAAVNSLRARLRVKIRPDDGRAISTTVLVTLKRPGAIRIETLGPIDELEAVFVLKDGRYTALSMSDRRVRHGPATAAVFEESFGLRLDADEFEAVLAGAFKVVEFTMGQIGADEAAKEVAVLIETPGAGKQIIRADRETLAVKRLDAYEGTEKRYTVEYFETTPVMGVPFAHRIKISFEGRLRSVDMKYREIELNPAVRDDEFTLDVPRGFSVEGR